MPIVSVSPATADEGDALTFTITMDEPAVDPVTLSYQPRLGTAQNEDLDYGLNHSRNTGTVTFAPGELTKTVSISTEYYDSADEWDESIELLLTALSSNASFLGGADHLTATGVILDDDGVGSNLALFVSDPAVVEGDGSSNYAEFELRLSRPATESFTVNYRTRDISATAGEDYGETIGSHTFAVGDQVATVRVPIYGDTEAEASEQFSLVVDPPLSPYIDPAALAGEATIRDDDTAPQPSVTISAAHGTEGYGLVFDVTLSESTFDAVSLSYRTFLGTAEAADLDYALTHSYNSGTLTFAPGETHKTIVIATEYYDSTDERDESISVRLSDLSQNASFAGGETQLSATGVILDNDGDGSNLALLVSDVTLAEGDSGEKAAVFELRLSRPAPESFTVSYRTRDISATAGDDYTQTTGTVSFAAGELVKTVSVPVLGDTLAEMTERFALVVDEPNALDVGVEGLTGEAVLLDDDTAPQPSVSVSAATATEGDALLFEVSLWQSSFQVVTVDYQTLLGTAQRADLDYALEHSYNTGTLTFAPGETRKMVTINTEYYDNVDERDESVVLRLTGVSDNASLAGGETQVRATGVILDDDGVGNNLALLVSDVVLTEGDDGTKYAEFELRLSRPAEDAMLLSYETFDITARAGEDYEAQTGSVSFAVGEETKVVSVPIEGDTAAEFSERFGLRVDTSSVSELDGVAVEGEALILDDDTAPLPSITLTPASTVEGGALLFDVFLSEAATRDVTVDYQTILGTAQEDDLDYRLDNGYNIGTLTFAPGETHKRVAIHTEYYDSEDERDETVFLELSNVSNASLADGAPSVRALGTILDDDGVGLNRIASIEPMILREQGVSFFTYEIPIVLSVPATAALDFNVSTSNQTATLGSDFRLLDTQVSFAVGESVATVGIEVLGDSVEEGTEAFTLSLSPVAGTPYAGSVADQTIYIRPGPLMPSTGDDVLVGTVGNDSINLLAGADHYRGLEGDDTVLGGAGDDTVIGGAGSDEINGGPGADLLLGGEVEDVSDATGARIFRVFQATLDRAPDSTGYNNWSGQLASGETNLLEVIEGFVNSAEFQETYGALGNAAFVNLLYQNVLGREADATGLNTWVAQLETGTSRAVVVRGFSESAEFKTNTNDAASAYVAAEAAPFADDVYRLFQATLDRAPDLTGLENWSGRLGEGMDYTDVAAGFVNSAEFQNVYGALNNAAFVTLLYNNVLGRDPDAGGLANWNTQLAEGMSREEVVRGFAQSGEFTANTAQPFHDFMAAQEGDTIRGGAGNDLIHGGLLADTFQFDAADKGSDRVLQLDAWDSLEFTGFGYGSAAAVASHLTETANDVIFADQGVRVIFMNTDLATMEDVSIMV